jgi:8-oxo-dGTP diphosphatase
MLTVTCAIIEASGLVLVAQRGLSMDLPYHWEFPGGKVQDGETEAACIAREIREELNLEVEVLSRFAESTSSGPERRLRLIAFRCRYCGGAPQPSEHVAVKWLRPRELSALTWCPADIPIVQAYVRSLDCNDAQ